MLNPIHARDWSTVFLAGGGGTTTAGKFAAMIKMVSYTGTNIIGLVSVTFIHSCRQTDKQKLKGGDQFLHL